LVQGGQGVTSKVFYPRLGIPNIQHMRYAITGGATFVDLERDAFTVALGYRIDAASLPLSAAASRSS
jgi:hypothetical protein